MTLNTIFLVFFSINNPLYGCIIPLKTFNREAGIPFLGLSGYKCVLVNRIVVFSSIVKGYTESILINCITLITVSFWLSWKMTLMKCQTSVKVARRSG